MDTARRQLIEKLGVPLKCVPAEAERRVAFLASQPPVSSPEASSSSTAVSPRQYEHTVPHQRQYLEHGSRLVGPSQARPGPDTPPMIK
jgi:hypothetical protein